MRSRVHAVIAVKQLRLAKTRLAGTLPPTERGRLVLAMLADTVAAATAVDAIGSVTVVTPDPQVRAAASAAGADVLADPAPTGGPDALNAALRHGARWIRERCGGTALLALQADLPALRADDLAAFLDAARDGARSFVADRQGTGTTALLQADPAGPLHPRFGPASALRHRESGAVEPAGDWPRLRLDVDTATDLALAIRLGCGPATSRLIADIGTGPGPDRKFPVRIGPTGCHGSGR